MAKSLTDRVAAVINYAAMSTRFLVALAGLTSAPVPAPRAAPNGTTKIAFRTDPWGTYIELAQGLAPAK
jgi:hypothetical protein